MTSPAKISPVEHTTKTNKMAKIGAAAGTLAGTSAGSAYIIKNRVDLFVRGGQKAAEALGQSKAAGKVVPGVVAAGIITTAALAGRLMGKLTGTIIDKVKAKKADNNSKIIDEEAAKKSEQFQIIDLENLKPETIEAINKLIEKDLEDNKQ